MAIIFQSKVDVVTDILSSHLKDNIKTELRSKILAHIDAEINQIINETTENLIGKIEAYNNTNGEITVNILFNKDSK